MTIPNAQGIFVTSCLGRFKVGWSANMRDAAARLASVLPAPSTIRWVFAGANDTARHDLTVRLEEWRAFGDWFHENEDAVIEVEAFATDFEQRAVERRRAPLMTLPTFARLANVSLKTAYRWVKSGKLEAFKVGSTWRIAPHALITDFPGVYELYVTDTSRPIGSSAKKPGQA